MKCWKCWGNYWIEDDWAGLAGHGEGVGFAGLGEGAGLAGRGEGVKPAEGGEGEGSAGCYKEIGSAGGGEGEGPAGGGQGVEFVPTCLGFPESAQCSVWHKRKASVSFGSCLSLKTWRDVER